MRSYPEGALAGNDYVVFEHYEYKASASRDTAIAGGGRGAVEATAPIPSDDMIRLYMPNSTPQISNGQTWSTFNSLPGPLGSAVRDLTFATGSSIDNIADGNLGSVVDNFKKSFENAKDTGGAITKQVATGLVAGLTGMSAANLTSITQGKIYNPNTELVYDGPGLRTFGMGFNFVPKSGLEAMRVNEIIKEFKKWSAPEEEGGMYKLPHVWKVTYVTNGRVNTMNRFKPSALVNVTIQANPSLSYHSTHTDGMPVEMAMTLDFKEMELITRKDHDDVGGQGF